MHGVHEVAGSSPVVPTTLFTMHDLEKTITGILERNRRVEADKAWERSFTRRFSIALMTYVIAAILLWWLGSSVFYWQAIVPAVGYILSTLSLPWIKDWWISRSSGWNT